MTIGKNFLSEFQDDTEKAAEVTNQEVENTEAAKEDAIEVVDETEHKPAEEVAITETENKENTAEIAIVPVEEPKPIELNDDLIKAYFKDKKGKEINSLDDLFKEPKAAIDPYEGLSDSAIQFLKFNKETGRDFNDFAELNKDYSKMSPLEAARSRVAEMANGKLRGEEIDQYLEKKLNIDLSDTNEIDKLDLVDLENFGSDYIKNKIAEQQKYKQPIERKAPEQQGPEMVTLENGVNMPKAQYENIIRQKEQYLESLKKAQDNITASVFEVVIDENGEEKKMNISFDFGQKDKHSMLSDASDTDKFIQDNFTKDGVIDHAKLQKGLFFAKEENLGKVISSAVQKARAEWIAESIKNSTNANFNTKKLPSETQKGRVVPIPGTQPSYGVQFSSKDF